MDLSQSQTSEALQLQTAEPYKEQILKDES